jgi:tetratricopeptide (TPR) repeat protein
MHRLVQAVLKAAMDEATQGQWAERAVRALNRVFPNIEFANWPLCERLLPQALSGAALIETWGFKFEAAGRLLNQTGGYLNERARHEEAEPLYQRALAIDEKALGTKHLNVGRDLNNLALLYYSQGRYEEAKAMFQRALTITEKALGTEHPNVVIIKKNYALLLDEMDRGAARRPLWKRLLGGLGNRVAGR